MGTGTWQLKTSKSRDLGTELLLPSQKTPLDPQDYLRHHG